jgi:excisionase family DNA binding protein
MNGNPLEDHWMNAREAARYLGYTNVQTLYNKLSSGEIKPQGRIGRVPRFKRSALDQWIADQTAAAESPAETAAA